jgi:DNA polymerase I-like protein with 3'-5' exonuclease and polymerase domains
MRADQTGFFWEDQERVSVWANKHAREKNPSASVVLPPVPDTGWVKPSTFPNLSNASILSIDTETYDPNLLESGPSIHTGGHIVGVSVATLDQSWYFPLRHTVGDNVDIDSFTAWAKQAFSTDCPKVFHSALYDLEWLSTLGIEVKGFIYDVSYAESLIDEESKAGYSLNAIAQKYLGEGKVEDDLYAWLAKAYGGKPTRRDQAKNIYRSPTALAGPYAEADAALPLRILHKQELLLRDQNLWELFRLECRLIAPLLYMRKKGVRVDVEGATRAYELFTAKAEEARKHVMGINVYAAEEIAYFCERNNISYPTTEKGNPSFTQVWLERHEDERIKAITNVRRYLKARDTFVQGYILDKHVNGRLYCLFHPLRGDENGTVSGRFSSSMPNLQNIPSRDAEIGPMLRALFLPEVGTQWLRFDWSQIEYRLLTHFARGPGAEDARLMYLNDPTTDFHDMTAKITQLDRKPAKNINFGLVYGMSEVTLAGHLGRPLHEAKEMFGIYHTKMPFVKYTYDAVGNAAKNRGYIKTILNRRRRFEQWEPSRGKQQPPLDYEAARAAYGAIRRAYTHKALNSLLQGSAADLMKLALVMIWDEGLLDDDFILHLLVHDEFDFSMPPGYEARAWRIKEIMEHCMELKVPILAEVEVGINWGMLQSFAP